MTLIINLLIEAPVPDSDHCLGLAARYVIGHGTCPGGTDH
jgi:hypothetical protein